jgi:hypothetical protein
MMLGVNPVNTRQMITCSIVIVPERAARFTVVYTSTDGGATWKSTKDAFYQQGSSDPVCDFAADGTALFLTELVPIDKEGINADIYRSMDGGLTWPAMTHVVLGGWDRSWFAIDRTKTSPYYGRIYDGAGSFTRSKEDDYAVMRSTDNGATWSPLVKSAKGSYLTDWMGNCDVATDGFLACVLYQRMAPQSEEYPYKGAPAPLSRMNATVGVVTSADGGVTFSPFEKAMPISFRLTSASESIPHLAIDKSNSAFHDRMYIIWVDVRTGRSEINLIYSTDRGATWSDPVRVSDDRTAPGINPSPWQAMPHIAVTPDGIVGAFWYDRRDDSGGTGYMPRFGASFDGGETFTPSAPVSEQPAIVSANDNWPLYVFPSKAGSSPAPLSFIWSSQHVSGGETLGFVATGPRQFRAIWPDDRTGYDQIWTAPINVKGQAVLNGAPELASLRDISKQIQLDVTQSLNDTATHTMTFSVRLHNVGPDTIVGPVKARAVEISAAEGVLFAGNADNGLSLVGAVWDFSGTLPSGRLEPDQTGTEKILLLRYAAPTGPLFTPGTPETPPDLRYGSFSLKLKILATAVVPSAKEMRPAASN